jgi:peptidoglycan glycosyltransferase
MILAGGFFQVLWAPSLATSVGNPRVQLAREQILRGGIFDYSGRALALPGDHQMRYVGPISLAAIVGYSDLILGQSGLEKAYDRVLLGLDGLSFYLYQWRVHQGQSHYGGHIITTIDYAMQRIAEEALGQRKGAVVILEPKSGAIRALVSFPSFDPNRVYEKWSFLRDDKDAPLLHRAVQGLYPPGSVFKMLILAAALEEGGVRLDTTYIDQGEFRVEGYRLTNAYTTQPGPITLMQAFANSSNVIFAQLALELGENKLFDYVDRFGFGNLQGLRVATSPARIFPPGSKAELVQFAIGQGNQLVTPLDIAVLTATIATGGLQFKAFLVQELVDSFGGRRQHVKAMPERVLSSFTSYQVTRAMLGVVENGTGTRAQVKGVSIAGKTGSAENPHGKPHAWFTCFAPADDPQLVVTVIVENAGSGGQVAAPIAQEILGRLLGGG